MELPALTFRSAAPSPSLESSAPLKSHYWCGIQWPGSNHSSSVHLSVQKSTGPVPASASSSHHFNDEDFGIESPSFRTKGHIHFTGVGGSGLSALAMLALKQVIWVSGSDVAWSSYMDALKEAGASLYVGHSERNLLHNADESSLPDAVVVSSAIPTDNVEVLFAKSLRVPVYKRGAWLGKLTKDYNLISVSGSHGKSTTTSMLAYVLKAMGDDLTAVVGAQVPQFSGSNLIYGDSHNFVLEADEYDGCFLGVSPHVAIVTNLDWKHVDIYPDEAVKEIFRKFLERIRSDGHLIIYGDKHGHSLGAFSLLNHPIEALDYAECLSAQLCSNRYNISTFGMSSFCNWQASSVSPNSHGGCDYQVVIAALSVILGDDRQFDKSIDAVKSHLKNFKGISRRFELIGKINRCHIIDDYAHHPTKVRFALQAARRMFPQEELLVVFQPHTYSRLAALRSEFASALSEADQVIVTEVYAARETNVWNIGGEDLAASITSPICTFIPSLENVARKLVDIVSKDTSRRIVILTVGSGDITLVGRKLLKELEQMRCDDSSVQFPFHKPLVEKVRTCDLCLRYNYSHG